MAKDPAFLFYPNDWLGGTMYLTRHQKGCYIDLLVAQFNSGPLSLETIKTVLGQDQAIWTVLSSKFKQDSKGNFFNERLATEVEKRKKYSDSRRDNISKRYKKATHVDTYVAHMNLHMENRNRNESLDEDRGSGGKEKGWNQKPTADDVGTLPQAFLEDAKQRIHLANYYTPPDEAIIMFFEAWKRTSLTGSKFYPVEEDVFKHFVNVVKKEKFKVPETTTNSSTYADARNKAQKTREKYSK